ncbi:MAG: BMP family ABC transporter substrate-binding protein, partial [Oscillospiraceae bacterium]|nr:BMP family ABC transporter substrate-binding protein [Oscillospiraceae bacterium]
MKKILALVLALCMIFALCACGQASAPAEKTDETEKTDDAQTTEGTPADQTPASGEKVKIGMVTDVGGVNDKSFNQTSWEGLQALAAEDGRFEVNYLESKTDADYQTNINTFIDEEYDLIICVGYMLADACRAAAEDNPDQLFAIIDDDTCADLPNV